MNPRQQPITLSLVVPMYNEEPVLSQFFSAISAVLSKLQEVDYEIICVSDGSTDQTVNLLIQEKQKNPRIKIIEFARNFGKEAALTAGLDHASGDVIIPIDADLQDPPDLIPEMIAKWREGYDMVLAVRSCRKADSFLKRLTSSWFYRIFNKLSDHEIVPNAGDYRLLDKSLVQAILGMPEKNRFMKGIFSWVTDNYTVIHYQRPERAAGKSKFPFLKLWQFSIDGIVSFSSFPLIIWSYIGLAISLVAAIYIIIVLAKTLIFGEHVHGYPSLMITILFLGGVQLISLGVMGEYIARIYIEVKNRPLYLIRKKYD